MAGTLKRRRGAAKHAGQAALHLREDIMNQMGGYLLIAVTLICALAFVFCACVTLVLIPVAFGGGFKAFKETKDLRDIVVARNEPPWVLQVYRILRKVQRFTGIATLAFGTGAVIWQSLVGAS